MQELAKLSECINITLFKDHPREGSAKSKAGSRGFVFQVGMNHHFVF